MSKALISESLLTGIADAIREKTGDAATMTPAEMIPAIESISTGTVEVEEKDVNFIDYDGTILYSYTAAEAAALEALPANPSHSGLTAQGWNYTLSEMQAEVTAQGRCVVGQTYVTDDGKTRIYCEFQEGRLSPYLGIGVNGTVVIDWGDGTSTITLSGSNYAYLSKMHTYAAAGAYVITITASSGTFAFCGNYTVNSYGSASSYSKLLSHNNDYSDIRSECYRSSIKKIELGTGARLYGTSDAGLGYLFNLETITLTADSIVNTTSTRKLPKGFFQFCKLKAIVIPKSETGNLLIDNHCFVSNPLLKSVSIPPNCITIGTHAFNGARAMDLISIPNGVSSIGDHAFYGCYIIKNVSLPDSLTSLASYILAFAGYMSSLTIPSGITAIAAQGICSMSGLAEIHFKSETPPTAASSISFYNLPTDCKIYVPRGCLSAYTSATNYPDSSTYTYVEED